MHEFSAAHFLETYNMPEHREVHRPNTEYLDNLHTSYGVELDSLVGLNAMTRPHEEQQRTVAELYYGVDSPAKVMEVNRTVMNVWLYDVIAGEKTPEELHIAYKAFTAAQREKGKLSFEEFAELKQIVDTAVPPEKREVFRAMLIYADLGKSTRMQAYMRLHRGREYANHDTLLLDVLEDEAAIRHCMPSFLEFTPEEQAYMKACFKSGFHLGQYQKLETLPVHLMGIQALAPKQRDVVLLNGFFDIGGSLGDKAQNGTPVLDSHAFQTFKKARASVHALPSSMAEDSFDPIERVLFCYQSYLEARNEEFGFDITTRAGQALARFVSMFRIMKPEEVAGVPAVFNTKLNAITQQLFVELLTMTGFENDSLWIEYGPALARNVYRSMIGAGLAFEDAMATSMTLLARIMNTAKRHVARRSAVNNPATVMVSKLAHIAGDKNKWHQLVTHNINVEQKHDEEYVAALQPVPEVTQITENRIDSLDYLKNDTGTTLYIGVGGGSDSEFARYTAETLIGEQNAPVVSFPGVAAEIIQDAERISDRVFLATPQTTFVGMRSFEGLSAQTGPCYIIADVERGDQIALNEAYTQIAAHIQQSGNAITRVVTVDSGGDIYKAAFYSWSRDIASLQAAEHLEEALDIEASHTVVLVPGVNAPTELNSIASQTDTRVYQLTESDMNAFLTVCEANGLPTYDATRYSQLLNLGVLAMTKTIQGLSVNAIEPLQLPEEQARRGRPAYGVVTRGMTRVLVTSNDKLRAFHRSSST